MKTFPRDIKTDCRTKEELFAAIRKLTRAGYFFEITNYYSGGKRDRAGYIIQVLGHKDDE